MSRDWPHPSWERPLKELSRFGAGVGGYSVFLPGLDSQRGGDILML